MKIRYFAALLTALTLVGCATQEDSGAPAPSSSTSAPSEKASPSATRVEQQETASATASEEPATSIRGNLVKRMGQKSGWTDAEGNQVVTFSVDKIQVDLPCTEPYGVPAEHGHFIGVKISVETSPELNNDTQPYFYTGRNAWKLITPEGTTFNGDMGTPASYGCISDTKMLPKQIGPGEKASGYVVLDSPSKSGTLVLAQMGEDNWEWSFGQAK